MCVFVSERERENGSFWCRLHCFIPVVELYVAVIVDEG